MVALSFRCQVRSYITTERLLTVWRKQFCLAEPLHNAMNPESSSLGGIKVRNRRCVAKTLSLKRRILSTARPS